MQRPAWPEGAITRPRLMARIDEGKPLLTLIVAPAGFGKTLTAAEWAQREPPAAWLSADAADASLPRFWAHLRAALEEVVPGCGELVTTAFRVTSRAPAVDLGCMLGDELHDAAEPVRLVIDDLHLVPEGEAHEFLTGLLETAPPALRLVVASRMGPPLPLPQLRLRGALGELRGEDLLFTAAETRRLLDRILSGASGANGEMAGTLWQRTGGWPASARLGALALARGGIALETVLAETQRAGSRLIASLLEDILGGRSREERQVLERAALPEVFTAGLAEALVETEGADPAQIVSPAIRFALATDLCRATTDRGGCWLAFHPLFRDALLARLAEQESPETVRSLHARAAAWCERAGRAEAAIPHWVAAGQVEAAMALVEREAPAAFGREDWPEVAGWLALLPDDVVDVRTELLLASAWVAQLRGQAVLLRDRLRRLKVLVESNDFPAEERENLRAEIELLTLVLLLPLQIDPEGAVEIARRAAAQIPSTRRYPQGLAWGIFGVALQAAGRGAEAVEVLTAWSEMTRAQGDVGTVRGLLGLLFVHAQAGELSRVESVGRFMREVAERHRLRLSLGWAHRFLGDVCYERNDLSGAIAHYGAVARDDEHVHLVGLREAFFGLARASLASGQVEEAWRAMRRCRKVMVDVGAVEHLPAIDACEVYLALRAGDSDRAMAWASANQPGVDDVSLHIVSHPAVIRAAILAAGGEAEREEALVRLGELRARAARVNFVGLLARLDALTAVVLMRRGETEAALAAMRASLLTGTPQGFTRTYLDLLPAFAPELGALAAHLVFPAAVRAALAAPVTAYGASASVRPDQPLDFLTRREREVLAALARRLSYQEIADQLFISPYTVKRHAAGIYSKLGVSGRLEAVRAAHELGWRP
jgi:LuxR family maltose regulon positive regulatory protein